MEYNKKKVYYDKKGYALIWIDGRDNKVHILEWEKHNGKKPEGMQVHHKDLNKKNWSIDNLELISQSDHFKIHAGWIRENGIWIKKPCKDCKKLLPLKDFYQRKGLTPSNICTKCSLIINKKRLIEDVEFRDSKRLYLKEYYNKNKISILAKQKTKRNTNDHKNL